MKITKFMAWSLVLATALALPLEVTAADRGAPGKWIATWASSPQGGFGGMGGPVIDGQTLRERARVSVGGSQLRLRLSNEYGNTPLVIGAVTVGKPVDPATVAEGSIKTVTFGGQKSVMVPAGAPIFTDPIDYPVKAGEEITISIYLPEKVQGPTSHSLGLKTVIISPRGDFTGATKLETASKSESMFLVTAITVPAKANQKLVVAFGDSITDGNASAVDGEFNWPSRFLVKVRKQGLGDKLALVNHGIGGNQLRYDGAGQSALARFDRDVLALPGVTHVVILEGINDIGWPGAKFGTRELAPMSQLPTAQDLIGAYKQLIARAHAHGIKVYGSTLTPFKGTDAPGYYMDSKEPIRAAVNEWIRTSGAFDAVIDWDKALRDPADPARLLPQNASRDHLHPSHAGYQAMADFLDPKIFR